MSSNPKASGEMMRYLPSIFHEDKFLVEYLSAFEKVLIGFGDPHHPGLEEIVADIAKHFDPQKAPEEFLPWLATWMAFGLRADLDVKHQRDFLTQIISLYKKRGTPESLSRLLKLFTGGEPTILEGDELASTNNTDWRDKGLTKWAEDGKPEHAFGVLLSFMSTQEANQTTAPEVQRKLAIALALIDLEKPAHTIYYLVPVFPSLTLPDFSTEGRKAGEADPKARSRIGFDTMLGVRRPTAKAATPTTVLKSAPAKVLKRAPQQASKSAPAKILKSAPSQASISAPQQAPKRAPRQASKSAPQKKSKKKGTSDGSRKKKQL
jgi:phage tail-like protein